MQRFVVQHEHLHPGAIGVGVGVGAGVGVGVGVGEEMGVRGADAGGTIGAGTGVVGELMILYRNGQSKKEFLHVRVTEMDAVADVEPQMYVPPVISYRLLFRSTEPVVTTSVIQPMKGPERLTSRFDPVATANRQLARRVGHASTATLRLRTVGGVDSYRAWR